MKYPLLFLFLMFGFLFIGGNTAPAGEPEKQFLNLEIHITPAPGVSPGPSGFSIKQIVEALGKAKKTWRLVRKDFWRVKVTKVNPSTKKYMTVQMLFKKLKSQSGKGALISKIIINGQNLNTGQIFQFIQQLAIRAEAGK